MTEHDYYYGREYFEDGCLCILNGLIEKSPSDVPNNVAFHHYMENCKCSRHPEYKGE